MKNTISNITTLLITLLLVTSCGSIKNMNPGDKKFEPPCTGKAYMSSKKAFREPGQGESIDYATSRKKALSNARSALAETVNSTIKKVEDNFVNSLEENNQEQIREKFQSNIRTVVDTQIQGSIVICEEATKNKETGRYTTYITMELSNNTLAQDIMNSFKKDEKNPSQNLDKESQMRIEFDYERFQDTFNKALEDFKGE